MAKSKLYALTEKDYRWLQMLKRWFDRRNRVTIDAKGGGIASGGNKVKLAKAQENGTTTDGLLSVKLCDAAGTVTGTAFDVYALRSKAACDLAEYFPYIASGDIVRVELRGDDWFLVSPSITYVDKF